MLLAWKVPISRPTRDIDLLARTTNDLEQIKVLISEICAVPVEDDGLVFDAASVQTVRIAEEALYEGVRAIFQGRLGNAKIPMQIDLGFSDVITPGPIVMDYPTVLEMPAPRLRAYNLETAIAEKFEAMVKLGELNSRMKDFFDIWTISTSFPFDGRILRDAVCQTFQRRGTVLTGDAVCLSQGFGASEARQAQWRAFLKRSDLQEVVPGTFAAIWSGVLAFLKPLVSDSTERMKWPPGGPWMIEQQTTEQYQEPTNI